MATFRFTTKTQCGKTDVIVQNGDTIEDAKAKYMFHNAMKHSPMQLIKTEVKTPYGWNLIKG